MKALEQFQSQHYLCYLLLLQLLVPITFVLVRAEGRNLYWHFADVFF